MGEDRFASGQKDACSLIAFGTCHGTYKGKLNDHTGARFYILKDIYIPRVLNFISVRSTASAVSEEPTYS